MKKLKDWKFVTFLGVAICILAMFAGIKFLLVDNVSIGGNLGDSKGNIHMGNSVAQVKGG